MPLDSYNGMYSQPGSLAVVEVLSEFNQQAMPYFPKTGKDTRYMLRDPTTMFTPFYLLKDVL